MFLFLQKFLLQTGQTTLAPGQARQETKRNICCKIMYCIMMGDGALSFEWERRANLTCLLFDC